MDRLSNLKYAEGSRKNRKRVGRGEGSTRGGQSTRGMNGQLSRSGAKKKAWFEGGQMPLQRRVPKFGFTPPFRVEFQVINLFQLQKLIDSKKISDADPITVNELRTAGAVASLKKPLKVLGQGEITSKVTIEANACSETAKKKIEAAGGTINTI